MTLRCETCVPDERCWFQRLAVQGHLGSLHVLSCGFAGGFRRCPRQDVLEDLDGILVALDFLIGDVDPRRADATSQGFFSGLHPLNAPPS